MRLRTPRHPPPPARVTRRSRLIALAAGAVMASAVTFTASGLTAMSTKTNALPNDAVEVAGRSEGSAVLAELANPDRVAPSSSVPPTTVTPATVTPTTEPPSPTYACPAPGADFIDSWGFARSGGRRHKGVDMMAPHGSPVLAPASGWIREHHSSLGGISYYLTTFDGTEFFGAHMQSFIDDFISPEGYVEAGALIGTVGSSGNASESGPHLHWEVKTAEGQQVNPYNFAVIFCSVPQPEWAPA